ncbi:glycosyltransferase [Carboxylicivirga sediminis]|uniref:Glycosyltransferase n=1 Tax=Carboxylicivirga sediminis TaxID=2006564 RepID=A0A941FC41_9BACT|nr:glycosyltransferase [Carboxylicivirga sediminis]MBR8538249.1 glycosyltransferase [Carboxylicivirga sediminis]
MTVVFLIILLPLMAYSVQIVGWYLQWLKTNDYSPNSVSETGLSLIIPFKDEAVNLPALIASLKQQSHENWELILVNDHSKDDSTSLLTDLLADFKVEYRLINSTQEGKKAALLEGVRAAQYTTIVTTDADCTFHKEWLTTLASYHATHKPHLLIGPVRIKKSRGFHQRFQQVDFTALQLSGAGAALQQQAIMCNGANLLCSKENYLQAHLIPQVASGDDMFLLEWMKHHKKDIHYIKAPQAMVETAPLVGLHAFLQQRARWAAKAPHYKNKHIILSGLLVALVNIMLFASLAGSFFYPDFLKLLSLYLLFKCLSDYLLLKAGGNMYKLRITLFEVIFWQMFYPFYVITVLVYPLIVPLKWKSRTL